MKPSRISKDSLFGNRKSSKRNQIYYEHRINTDEPKSEEDNSLDSPDFRNNIDYFRKKVSLF
jgi:hypothetical protein